MVTTSALNCRTGRGTGYSIITTLAKGSTVTVWYIDKASNGALWGSCSCASKTGYISMSYTTPKGSVDPTPTPTPVVPTTGTIVSSAQLSTLGWTGITTAMVNDLNSCLKKFSITTTVRIRQFMS